MTSIKTSFYPLVDIEVSKINLYTTDCKAEIVPTESVKDVTHKFGPFILFL